MSDEKLTALVDELESVVAAWGYHDVVSCPVYVCPDCAVSACAYDVRRVLLRRAAA